MAIGSGLSGSFGMATESTPGTSVAATRFYELNKESLVGKKHTVQGAGLRGGALTKRGSRRVVTAREAGGSVNIDLPTAGIGLLFQHMLGSFSTTATSLGGGLFQQIHNAASLQGKTFTSQVVKPDYTGVLTQNAFTFPGCKVTDWEISGQAEGQLQVDVTIDAFDQITPSNNFAGTTLSSASVATATTLSTVATIVAGSYIVLDAGTANAEVFVTGTPTGAGPFTIPITPSATKAHVIASAVTSPTAVNAGAAAVLQAPSYTAGTSIFSYDAAGSSLISGGVVSVVSNVWTVTGGTTVGNVRSFSLKGTNPLKLDRFGIGSAIKSEQLENDFRSYTLETEIEYASPYFTQAYLADSALALQLKFTAPGGLYLQITAPVSFQNDGTTPALDGPDILIPKLQWELLDDGTNGAIQVVLVNTDAAV